jgi:4-hydroxy-tetrahydrodipicolinate synthase
VTSFIIDANKDRLPVVLGIGGNDTSQVVSSIQSTDLSKISAILSVAPFYNKPSQAGLYEHYKAISVASPLPVILYNVPGRTSSNISAETTLKLAHEFENIVAVKEASGNMAQIMQIIKNKPEGFSVLSGDDALTLSMVALGGDGVISVVANAFPKEFSTMVHEALNQNLTEARKIHYALLEIIGTLFEEGSPAGVKAALYMLDIIPNVLRLPLMPVSTGLFDKLKKQISGLANH